MNKCNYEGYSLMNLNINRLLLHIVCILRFESDFLPQQCWKIMVYHLNPKSLGGKLHVQRKG